GDIGAFEQSVGRSAAAAAAVGAEVEEDDVVAAVEQRGEEPDEIALVRTRAVADEDRAGCFVVRDEPAVERQAVGGGDAHVVERDAERVPGILAVAELAAVRKDDAEKRGSEDDGGQQGARQRNKTY